MLSSFGTNTTNNHKKRRAAAEKADTKIKANINEFSRWTKSLFYDTDADEASGPSKKKPKLAKQQQATNKRGTMSSSSSTASTVLSSSSKSINESSSKPKAARSEWQDDEILTSSVVQERNLRRAARNVQSGRPMFLSRRLSWKINKAAEGDHSYSPLAALHLTFVPASCVVLQTRRGASP